MSRAGDRLRRMFPDDPEFLERVRAMEIDQITLNETDQNTWAAARKLIEDAGRLEQQYDSGQVTDDAYERNLGALVDQIPRAVLAAASKISETMMASPREGQEPEIRH